ncbi:fasciclin domain-containing protein [Roseovarius salis]|uniref:fasciclin domain-containing protein n=1 Tax=Roseovarius salis TaxID=3376063 RepID=UPI0037CB8768
MFGKLAIAATTAMLTASAGFAANPMVGGAPMYADKTIVENAVNSDDHETLVTAVKAAGLVETLQGEGPFTVFAPTDAAFGKLPDETVKALLTPPYKDKLTEILTCHVVPADAMAADIRGMIDDDGGMHVVPTLGGCELEARHDGANLMLTDERGQTIKVTIADVEQSNGVIHVIDTVILPGME